MIAGKKVGYERTAWLIILLLCSVLLPHMQQSNLPITSERKDSHCLASVSASQLAKLSNNEKRGYEEERTKIKERSEG